MHTDKQVNNKDFSTKAGKWMIVMSWVAALGLMTLLFSNLLEHKRNPNQNLSTQILNNGSKEVVLQSSAHGHYVASGKINNKKVIFLVDTGASFVSVPESVAKRVGLKKGNPLTASTANGSVTVYSTMLEEISIGDIVLYNIRADINPHMEGEEVLLGMSFLRNLSVTHEDGKLSIRY